MNGLFKWVDLHPARRPHGLDREMERLFAGLHGSGGWPAEEVSEDEDGFSLAIALPGLGAADVAVTVESGTLKVAAKGDACSKEGAQACCSDYRREFTVPDTVAEDKVAATMKDGVLRVSLPKKEEAKPRRRELTVKAG